MANNAGDGKHSPNGEGSESSSTKTTDGADRKTSRDARVEERTKDKEKKFHLSKTSFIIGGVCAGVVLIGVFLYWLHARNFVSTDDAYTTTHVHEISARVAGTVQGVDVDDNQSVKAGQK